MVRQGFSSGPEIIFGVIVPIVLAAMIWSTVQIRHTQAATGLLYLASGRGAVRGVLFEVPAVCGKYSDVTFILSLFGRG